jgi:hypothetical protein
MDLHPAGQRLGDSRHEEDIGRAGQEKATGPAVAIHSHLDGWKERGRSLHLVEHRGLRQARNKSGRIRGCCGKYGGLVESQVAGRLMDGPHQGALANLPGAVDQDDGPVGQRLSDHRSDVARDHGRNLTAWWSNFNHREGRSYAWLDRKSVP